MSHNVRSRVAVYALLSVYLRGIKTIIVEVIAVISLLPHTVNLCRRSFLTRSCHVIKLHLET